MKKQIPVLGIIGAVNNGLPLIKDFISIFKKHPKTPEDILNGLSQQDLINHIKTLESKEEKPILVKIVNFLITAATVYGVVYVSKQFGVTYQDIITLFGLVKVG